VWEVCLELFCFVPICSSCSRERARRLLQGRMVLAAFFPLFFRFYFDSVSLWFVELRRCSHCGFHRGLRHKEMIGS